MAEQANIRLEPEISSIIIRQVPQGTILNATEKTGDWFAVQLAPKEGTTVSGYVHESLVAPVEPLPPPKTPPKKKEEEDVRQKPIPPPPKIGPEEPGKTLPFRFALSVGAGGNYVKGGDSNLGIEGLADLYEDILGVQGVGKIKPVHLGYVFGVEVSFPISPTVSWGVDAEHFRGKSESEVDYAGGEVTSILLMRPDLRATPVSLFLSFNPSPYLYIKGGVSYFFARWAYTYLLRDDNSTQQWEGKANSGGLGLLGRLGFKKDISQNMSLFAEITGRLAKIKGFEGTEVFQDSSGITSTEEGSLYLIQTQVLADRVHPVMFIRKTRPNEAGVIDSAEAQLDYSGIGIRIGLRFHF